MDRVGYRLSAVGNSVGFEGADNSSDLPPRSHLRASMSAIAQRMSGVDRNTAAAACSCIELSRKSRRVSGCGTPRPCAGTACRGACACSPARRNPASPGACRASIRRAPPRRWRTAGAPTRCTCGPAAGNRAAARRASRSGTRTADRASATDRPHAARGFGGLGCAVHDVVKPVDDAPDHRFAADRLSAVRPIPDIRPRGAFVAI